MPQVFLWQAARLARKYARQGDLIVCEVNKILNLTSASPGVAFSTPDWVGQVLEGIDRPMDEILADMNQSMRRKIRRIENQGYTYEYSKELEDFDLFYQRMYSPYIRLRYGAHEELRSFEDMRSYFIECGGLILVKQYQELICGMICYLDNGGCDAHEMGVMDGRFELVKQGSNVALWWFMLDWARGQGSKWFNFGNSRAHTSDGPFNFKRQWGTRVQTDKHKFIQWGFYCENLPALLRKRLNEQGWISEISGGHYQVYLREPGETAHAAYVDSLLEEAARSGLDGVVLISASGERQIISRQFILHKTKTTVTAAHA
jgi:hypothetical protein